MLLLAWRRLKTYRSFSDDWVSAVAPLRGGVVSVRHRVRGPWWCRLQEVAAVELRADEAAVHAVPVPGSCVGPGPLLVPCEGAPARPVKRGNNLRLLGFKLSTLKSSHMTVDLKLNYIFCKIFRFIEF